MTISIQNSVGLNGVNNPEMKAKALATCKNKGDQTVEAMEGGQRAQGHLNHAHFELRPPVRIMP